MELTTEMVAEIIAEGFRRCELARSIGIAHYDIVNGTPIPFGWSLDFMTGYWLPPNTYLETRTQ